MARLEQLTQSDRPITYGVVKPGDERPTYGIKLIRGGDVAEGRIADNLRTITQEVSAPYRRTLLRGGELLVSLVGNPGEVAVVPASLKGANLARQVGMVALRSKVCTKYVMYALRSPAGRASLFAHTKGSVQQVINLADLKRVQIPFPPDRIQRRIADILSAYDDLIENNTRRIAILEDMARRLFEEWFGNADEVSGSQPIRIDRLIDFDPKTKVPKEGRKAFLPMPCVQTNSMVVSEWEEREGNSGSKFLNGDTLLARITPCLENGKTAFVDFLGGGEAGFGSTEFIVMRGRSAPPEFVYCLARSGAFREHAIKSMSGATGRQRVSSAAVAQFEISEPDPNQLERFGKVARPMFQMIRSLADANTKLRRTRDLLLPKLISGEVEVGVAGEALEASAA
ncbi:MAG TPA: restriction endonuclease subunit S [Sphingomonas sp.]|nr:restriction endonuclease subunit S [Sphingomonas sp.]